MTKWQKDDEQHSELESEAVATLREFGYEVGEAPYHSKMSDQMIDRLHKSFQLPSLLVRTRADRLAVHSDGDAVKVEAKTHSRRDKHDFTVELLPLVEHLRDHEFCGAETIYVYRNPVHPDPAERGKIYAAYAHDMAEVVAVALIPDRPENAGHMEWFRKQALDFFGKKAFTTAWKRPGQDDMEAGSGDPFVIIPERLVHGCCRTLKQLLQDRAREKGRAVPAGELCDGLGDEPNDGLEPVSASAALPDCGF